MKIVINKLLNSVPILKKVFDAPMKDFKTAYSLTKIQKKIDKEINDYYEAQNKLVSSYAKKDKDGQIKIKESGQPDISEKELEKLTEEINSLRETEIELDIWKIPFKVVEGLELSVNEMANLVDFIEEPGEDKAEKTAK